MAVLEYLQHEKTHFRVTEHEPVYTARQLARVEKIKPQHVAKSVVIQADGDYYICVLPADRLIDFHLLRKCLRAKKVELASESDMIKLFGDCEVGAEPPLGAHYNLSVLMDESTAGDKQIVFFAGSHSQSVWMDMEEYQRLVKPRIENFIILSSEPGIG